MPTTRSFKSYYPNIASGDFIFSVTNGGTNRQGGITRTINLPVPKIAGDGPVLVELIKMELIPLFVDNTFLAPADAVTGPPAVAARYINFNAAVLAGVPNYQNDNFITWNSDARWLGGFTQYGSRAIGALGVFTGHKQVIDFMTAGKRKGVLVATDKVTLKVSVDSNDITTTTGSSNITMAWKLYYRYVKATSAEYVGILQGQQTA